jgi:hypothetical protein
MFVVLDVDGTIADNTHRAHHVEKEPKNWEAFSAPGTVIKDTLIPGVARVVTKFQEMKCDIVILTGRTEDLRDTTMRWLLENLNLAIPDTSLLMRPNGNMLSAAEYKRDQILSFKQGLDNRDGAFLFIEDDAETCVGLEPFGTVLKAPECWGVLFPVPAVAPE